MFLVDAGCGFRIPVVVVDEIGSRHRHILLVVLDEPRVGEHAAGAAFDATSLSSEEVVRRISTFADVPAVQGWEEVASGCDLDDPVLGMFMSSRTDREVVETYRGEFGRDDPELLHMTEKFLPGKSIRPAVEG